MRVLEKFLVWCDRRRKVARRRSWSAAQALGRDGEDLAHRFLQQGGYYVVARNYKPPSGSAELDIVARQGDLLVFVEVKSRQSEEFGSPDRNIDSEKKWKMVRAARDYLRRSGHDPKLTRFDSVSIVIGAEDVEIRHGEGIFTLPDAL